MFGERENQLFVSILSTLVNGKHPMISHLLMPVGVPTGVYDRLLYRRDTKTGRTYDQEQLADEIWLNIQEQLPTHRVEEIVQSLIEIAVEWSQFELAACAESAAMTVMAARMYQDERNGLEATVIREGAGSLRGTEQRRMAIPVPEPTRKNHKLLGMFDALFMSGIPKMRGNWLRTLLENVIVESGIVMTRELTPNQVFETGDARVTGEFDFDGYPLGMMARWTDQMLGEDAYQELLYWSNSSGYHGGYCLLLSLSGWTPELYLKLRAMPETRFLLIDGRDFRVMIERDQMFTDVIIQKMRQFERETGRVPLSQQLAS